MLQLLQEQSQDLTPALNDIGEYLLETHQQHFIDLNPKQQRAVVTVVSTTNGTATVQYADGGYQVVLGDSVANGKV